MQQERTILWKCLDKEGMEACRFRPMGDGWEIQGTASYRDPSDNGGKVASLTYTILCTADWITQRARVNGWMGDRDIHIDLNRSPTGQWTGNGRPIDGTDGLFDVDLGFTPATNTIAIRRLNLAIGAEAETTAVWLDISDWSLKPLRQIYRRTGETAFEYASPDNDFATDILADDFGVVLQYPALWKICA